MARIPCGAAIVESAGRCSNSSISGPISKKPFSDLAPDKLVPATQGSYRAHLGRYKERQCGKAEHNARLITSIIDRARLAPLPPCLTSPKRNRHTRLVVN